MPLIRDFQLDLPEHEIAARLQIRKGQTIISEKMSLEYKKTLSMAYALIEPAAIWEIFPIKKEPVTSGIVVGGLTIRNPDVIHLLTDCEQACFMAVTIGPAISRKIIEFTEKGDLVSASFLDAIASALADEAVEKTETAVRYSISKGHPVLSSPLTRRFSPGYSDWGLEVQPEIIQLLDAGRIGINTTSTHVLVPEKSVTAILGVRDLSRGFSKGEGF